MLILGWSPGEKSSQSLYEGTKSPSTGLRGLCAEEPPALVGLSVKGTCISVKKAAGPTFQSDAPLVVPWATILLTDEQVQNIHANTLMKLISAADIKMLAS